MLFAISKVIKTTLYSLCFFIDSIVYSLISIAYQVFIAVSKVSLYGNIDDKINALTDRIYVILGVTMLFVLAYNIILLILNPDKATGSGDKSLSGFLKNFVISIVLITLLPTVFDYMTKLQNDIIDSHVIESIILGSSDSDSNNLEQMGSNVATIIYSTFYHPIDKDDNAVSYVQCKSGSGASASCSDYINAYDKGRTGKVKEFITDSKLEDALTSKNPTMDFLPVVSTICGIMALLMFVSYAIDIGIRVAKLTFFQIIAPVPVILRITKPSGGTFSKWSSNLIKTYLSLFLRLITIYFAMFLIQLITDSFGSTEGGIFANAGSISTIVKLFAGLIVIIGILLFAKEVPKLLEDFLGSAGGGGFSPKSIAKKVGGITGAPLIGGALGAAGALAGRGIGAGAGAAGGAWSALRNNARLKMGGKGAEELHHMDVAAATKQGARQGSKGGGLKQFNKQGSNIYEQSYGYGKKQGITGGKSLGTTLDEKYGKAFEKNVKQHAKDINDKYIATHVDPNVPKDEAGIQNTKQNYNSTNKNFANIKSGAYQKALASVEAEESAMGIPFADKKAKINDKLSQIAATTTDANEKRSIDSYLARESIMSKYENSVLNNNPAAIEKVKQDAAIETRKIVNAEIKSKGVENIITNAADKTILENNARIEVANKISAVGGDISKISFSDEAKRQINSDITAKVTTEIQNIQNNGGINSVTLSQKAEADLQKQLSNIVSANPNLQNSDITKIEQKLRTEAVTKQVTQTVSTQVIQDYMFNDEYTKQVSDHLVKEKKGQVESYMIDQAKNAAASEIAAQIKDYEVGKVTGTYSDDVTGKLDKEYNANFVQNEKIHNDGVKSKSALDLAMDQIKEAVKEKTGETKSKPKAENDKK